MSEEQVKAFLEKVKADTSLQEKLKAAGDANAVAAIAKEAGFSISADDLTKAQSELSEEELEGVAGGGGPPDIIGISMNNPMVCHIYNADCPKWRFNTRVEYTNS